MPGRVTLLVTAGPIQGRRFEFTEHDTFLFGRSPDCHAQLRPASDVWSMGATLYYMLTRQYTRDFAGRKDPLAVVLSGRIVPLRRRAPRLPAAVATVVDRAIADDPGRRYPTASEL